MRAYRRLGEALAATLLLLAPAMWNRFPFLQYDSGGYLARWFEGYLGVRFKVMRRFTNRQRVG